MCTTLPSHRHKTYVFPYKEAFIHHPSAAQPYKTLGLVRSKVNFSSLDPNREESELCQNYYYKSVRDLVSFSKDKGGDAVIEVKSVVFLEDGRHETYSTPECADDGIESQILTQGIAIKWLPKKPPIP